MDFISVWLLFFWSPTPVCSGIIMIFYIISESFPDNLLTIDNNLIFLNLPVRLGHLVISEWWKTVGGWAQRKHLLITEADRNYSSKAVSLTFNKLCSLLMPKKASFLSDCYRCHC